MEKLNLGNLNSILENLKESKNNIKNILEKQSSTLDLENILISEEYGMKKYFKY